MKDAFGGSFILRIMLVFFVVFICFMTVAINFAKIFRIKSNVINILERSHFSDLDTAKVQIDDYLRSVSYSYPGERYTGIRNNCNTQRGELTDYGVCIVTTANSTYSYYKVTAYIVMEFPLFNFGAIIPISGETKILHEDRRDG